MQQSVVLKNINFIFEVNHKNIRSIRLKLTSSNSFIVSCPKLTPEFVIKKFISSNADWIVKNSQKISPKSVILDLKKLSILDRPYQLLWMITQQDSVLIFENDQKIYINLSKTSESHAKKILEKRFRAYALTLIKGELRHLSNMFGFEYNRVSVRNQSSRYGSCSSKGNLNFNWQIIFFPADKFRHILLHELTHLKIKNHSKTFWNQLNIYDPNSKSNNLWLKKEGTKYFII